MADERWNETEKRNLKDKRLKKRLIEWWEYKKKIYRKGREEKKRRETGSEKETDRMVRIREKNL